MLDEAITEELLLEVEAGAVYATGDGVENGTIVGVVLVLVQLEVLTDVDELVEVLVVVDAAIATVIDSSIVVVTE